MSLDPRRAVFLVTGIQAAGKSTVGRLLAERFARGAFIEGDLLWKMVASGRQDMTRDPSREAVRQLHLRYRNGARLADAFFGAGFAAVHADIVLEGDVQRYAEWVRSRPLVIVMLVPRPSVVAERERARGSSAYRDWTTGGRSLEDAVAEFQTWVERTPQVGIRVDSSDQSPQQTVDEIMARAFDEGLVD